MAQYYAATLRDIRDKYIGSASEHDLLKQLISAEESAEERFGKLYNQQIASLEHEKETMRETILASQTVPLDYEFFQFKRMNSILESWATITLIDALVGRGVTSAELMWIAEELMRREEQMQKDKEKET